MVKIVVASRNPVKLNAALEGFKCMFPDKSFELEAVSASSNVREQPLSDHETFQGAFNRASTALKEHPLADFWVGLEGGVEEMDSHLHSFAWAVVRSSDQKWGKGRTATFVLPPKIAALIRQGMELGSADDVVFKKSNSKQENGAVGLLTGNVIDRKKLYMDAVILALIPFKNAHLYP